MDKYRWDQRAAPALLLACQHLCAQSPPLIPVIKSEEKRDLICLCAHHRSGRFTRDKYYTVIVYSD